MSTVIASGSEPVTVCGATGSPAVRGVLASLPASFAVGEDGAVRAVDGAPGWARAAAAAIGSGTGVVVVTEPQPDEESAIEQLAAAARGATVLLAEGWAGNPAVAAAVAAWNDDLAAADLVEAELFVAAEPSEAHLLALLRLLRALGRPVPNPCTAVAVAGSLAIVARDGLNTWSLLVSRTTGPERAYASLAGDLVQVELQLPSPATAEPAHARRIDTRHEEQLDTRYETAHRAAWRRARLAVDHPTAGDDLLTFASDLRAARSAIATVTTRTRKETL